MLSKYYQLYMKSQKCELFFLFKIPEWKQGKNLSANQQFGRYDKRVEGRAESHRVCVPWSCTCVIAPWWLALSFIWLQFPISVHDITAVNSRSSVLLTVCFVVVATAWCLCLSTDSIIWIFKHFSCHLGVSRGRQTLVHLKHREKHFQVNVEPVAQNN